MSTGTYLFFIFLIAPFSLSLNPGSDHNRPIGPARLNLLVGEEVGGVLSTTGKKVEIIQITQDEMKRSEVVMKGVVNDNPPVAMPTSRQISRREAKTEGETKRKNGFVAEWEVEEVDGLNGEFPSPRNFPSFWHSGSGSPWWMFGGVENSSLGPLSDLWTLDEELGSWRLVFDPKTHAHFSSPISSSWPENINSSLLCGLSTSIAAFPLTSGGKKPIGEHRGMSEESVVWTYETKEGVWTAYICCDACVPSNPNSTLNFCPKFEESSSFWCGSDGLLGFQLSPQTPLLRQFAHLWKFSLLSNEWIKMPNVTLSKKSLKILTTRPCRSVAPENPPPELETSLYILCPVEAKGGNELNILKFSPASSSINLLPSTVTLNVAFKDGDLWRDKSRSVLNAVYLADSNATVLLIAYGRLLDLFVDLGGRSGGLTRVENVWRGNSLREFQTVDYFYSLQITMGGRNYSFYMGNPRGAPLRFQPNERGIPNGEEENAGRLAFFIRLQSDETVFLPPRDADMLSPITPQTSTTLFNLTQFDTHVTISPPISNFSTPQPIPSHSMSLTTSKSAQPNLNPSLPPNLNPSPPPNFPTSRNLNSSTWPNLQKPPNNTSNEFDVPTNNRLKAQIKIPPNESNEISQSNENSNLQQNASISTSHSSEMSKEVPVNPKPTPIQTQHKKAPRGKNLKIAGLNRQNLNAALGPNSPDLNLNHHKIVIGTSPPSSTVKTPRAMPMVRRISENSLESSPSALTLKFPAQVSEFQRENLHEQHLVTSTTPKPKGKTNGEVFDSKGTNSHNTYSSSEVVIDSNDQTRLINSSGGFGSGSESSKSMMFFSLSLSFFGVFGFILFVRRCVKCPPANESEFVAGSSLKELPMRYSSIPDELSFHHNHTPIV